jgi:hypothetical protein
VAEFENVVFCWAELPLSEWNMENAIRLPMLCTSRFDVPQPIVPSRLSLTLHGLGLKRLIVCCPSIFKGNEYSGLRGWWFDLFCQDLVDMAGIDGSIV